MVEPQAQTLFVQLALVLVAARLLGRLARRVGVAPVVGELLTGIVLGQSLLGAVFPGAYAAVFPADGETLAPFAAVGLVLLLVLAGVETDLAFVRRRAVGAVAVTAGGVAVPFALGFVYTWRFRRRTSRRPAGWSSASSSRRRCPSRPSRLSPGSSPTWTRRAGTWAS